MSTDAFVAFFAGICAGMVIGITISAILTVIGNTIEKEENK